ncbi:TrmB family transcriptional regulator sugar-binding domain-containing protein [Halalkalicoccus sp. NIPERK01]|uniref:TrmB family transcriptional regulator n=1 Tax=Halalkalicoccus sp. NIPERK01 TaxID=3053469 RepID=UPI00256F4215|nr:TrmB family transcriptional regulator sugar-binding domain-containing protein [Halalkalicoccus sp. NIPERK01]MDL5361540.1 TrmB family transcriptional regulator sugar-binding domain-containing protein [Halalkalicoccus sp. NIPERK01]
MKEATLRSQLAAFGLSEKEIDTYLTLLELGEAKTSAIADDSGVSQRYVYQIAEDLEERGLAIVKDHATPTTIAAVPPERAVEGLVSRLRSLQPGLKSRFTEAATQTASFNVIKSRQTVLKEIRRIVDSANEEAFLALPHYAVEKLEEDLEAAFDRDAMIVLHEGAIDPQSPEVAERRFDGLAHVVRQWHHDMPFVVTAEGSSSGIVGERRLLRSDDNDREAVAVSESQVVGSMFGAFQGGFWAAGEEVYTGDPASLPATYTMTRPAVLNAVLAQLGGRMLRAEVSGYTTDTEEPRTVTGRIVEIRQGLVEPFTNSFPVENSLTLETDDGERLTVGGAGAFVEDLRANETTLRPVE